MRRIVDVFTHASFDVAPTLLAWMARRTPATYGAVLAADRASARRTGYGNAIAHPYHHSILPLLSRRDKVTEVRWGLAEFARHFGRAAEGMWLPEMAVDDETLDVLAQEGVRFTLLAPHQLDGAPRGGRPGRYRTSGGRELTVCTYDAEIGHDVAFGPLVRDGLAWAARLRARLHEHADVPSPVVAVAANAETFGLHHRFGEKALAGVLDALGRPGRGSGGLPEAPTPVVNFASVLAAEPATDELRVHARTSWSCLHGLGRWQEACGCRYDASTDQRWRAPLVAALAELRTAVDERFAAEGGALFGHLPGGADAARDAYNGAPATDRVPADALALAGGVVPETADPVWARELLEMAREALAMADSDGIGADDLADPATQAVLAHAARAATLAGPRAEVASARLRRALSMLAGDHAAAGAARAILERLTPVGPPLAVRVAAGVAAVDAVGAPDGPPPAWWADVDRSAPNAPVIHVADRRLGDGATYVVTVDVPSANAAPGRAVRRADIDARAVTILVRPVPGAPGARPAFADALGAALKLGDLPEPARVCVELALRRAVVQRLLDAEDRARLAAGEARLRVLAGAALVQAIDALGEELRHEDFFDSTLGPRSPNAAVSGPAVARVLGLADLAESAGAGTPFDAQTALYRLGLSLPRAARAQLAPLAWRLGFSARGWRELDDGTPGAER
ncbi:hypothetical protein tb265_19950 [Gemmatimonadetes bacterium T265]|nr:hypothetical protein tb265_19950 [Gemmatimonadetes bacterium T265]